LIAIGVPLIPRIRLDRFRKLIVGRAGAIQRNAFAAMQIGGDVPARGFEMRVTRENGDLTGRIIQTNAKHGKAAGGHLSVAELHAHLPRLPSALKLEISQAAVEHEHSITRCSRSLEHLQRQRTVR
jgi:hypothetical protein